MGRLVVVREHCGDYPSSHGDPLETVEKTLDEIRHPPGWNRYAFAWLEPQLDKTGEVAEVLLEAVTVDPASADQPLDAYVNMVYRSLKNSTLSLERASLLDAQESIPWYLEFVFAVHGRVRPFNKWLEWELERHPLATAVELDRLERITRTGAVTDQQALFREVEALARDHGLGGTMDGWEPDLPRLRG